VWPNVKRDHERDRDHRAPRPLLRTRALSQSFFFPILSCILGFFSGFLISECCFIFSQSVSFSLSEERVLARLLLFCCWRVVGKVGCGLTWICRPCRWYVYEVGWSVSGGADQVAFFERGRCLAEGIFAVILEIGL